MTRIIAALPFLALASPAAAELRCAPVARFLADYEAQFNETPQWVGSFGDGSGGLMIVTAPNGSWTLFTIDDDEACQLGYGTENATFPKANV